MTERGPGDGTVAKALSVDGRGGRLRPPRALLRAAGPLRPTPRPTLYRFVQVLTKQGMLHFRPRSADLCARPAPRPSGPCRVARPRALAPVGRGRMWMHSPKRWARPSTLAQLDGAQVLYGRPSATPPSRSRCIRPPARSAPAYCTGVGKAMIAFLPEEELAASDRSAELSPASRTTPTRPRPRCGPNCRRSATRLRLRPRGTRAGDHLHRASES